jgi:hypothetical protein
MEDFKNSLKRSLANFYSRQDKLLLPKQTQKRMQPEKELRKSIIPLFEQRGFFVLRLESQAVFSPKLGRYLNQQVSSGTSDLILCSPHGHFFAVELKAPGRLNTLKPHQREFLTHVIHQGGFACVIDSIERFDDLYSTYLKTPDSEKKNFLLSSLPQKREPKQNLDPLFDNCD